MLGRRAVRVRVFEGGIVELSGRVAHPSEVQLAGRVVEAAAGGADGPQSPAGDGGRRAGGRGSGAEYAPGRARVMRGDALHSRGPLHAGLFVDEVMTEATTLSPQYSATDVEAALYAEWEARGYFTPSTAPGARPYVIVIPPPNVTGVLHMGHGLNNTVQDALIRFERMRGRAALWVPGTDHAGIATQNVVERMLAAEGKTRFDLGRDAFVERVWAFVRQTGHVILGPAAGDRLLVRLDADALHARPGDEPRGARDVRAAVGGGADLPRLPRDPLVPAVPHGAVGRGGGARGRRGRVLPHPLSRSPTQAGHIIVATTRPETLLGDVAVAVNPSDPARAAFVGRHVVLPIADLEIPIIADEHVEAGFGTGFVKITPAHDADDFEVGKRHNLATPIVMTPEARMADAALNGKAGRPRPRAPVRDGPLRGPQGDRADAQGRAACSRRSRAASTPCGTATAAARSSSRG